jgi:hypothetical protein
MKTKLFIAMLAGMIVMQLCLREAWAQLGSAQIPPLFSQRNLSGPRLGFTFVPGNKELANELKAHHMGSVLSQFGWHFEYQVIPEGGGPSFVVECVPLVAGVEYGTVIPSVSVAMGIRFPGGFEFGLGPNVLAGNEKKVHSALVIAVGKSFNYGGVSIPLNLVCVTSPSGNRYSFMFGYAIARSVKQPSPIFPE